MDIKKYEITQQNFCAGISWISSDIRLALLKFDVYDSAHRSYQSIKFAEIEPQLHHPDGGVAIHGRNLKTNAQGLFFYCDSIKIEQLTANIRAAAVYSAQASDTGIENPLLFYIDLGRTLEFQSTLLILSWSDWLMRW